MPALEGVKESCLYVDDLPRSLRFYKTVMGMTPVLEDQRLCVLSVGGDNLLLLFQRGASLNAVGSEGERIPPHDGSGPVHIGFGAPSSDMAAWEERLTAAGVEIERRQQWPRGGRSIYFRDPDNHLLELLTPGTWPTY